MYVLYLMFFLFVSTWSASLPQGDIKRLQKQISIEYQSEIPEWASTLLQAYKSLSKKVSEAYDGLHKLETELTYINRGWKNYNNMYSYWVSESAMDWNEGEYMCEAKNGRLAAKGIRDPDIYNFIRDYLVNNVPGSDDAFWIGLSDIKSEGVWEWSDGVLSTSTNTHWNPGEPNDNFGEDCGELWRDSAYINDKDCGTSHRIICEYDLS